MTWKGNRITAVQDRMGGITITHEDGSDVYLQPGDEANGLEELLEVEDITPEQIDQICFEYWD